jgi:hypothetical protein
MDSSKQKPRSFLCKCGCVCKTQRGLEQHQSRYCSHLRAQVHENLGLTTTTTFGKNARIAALVKHTALREDFRKRNDGKHHLVGKYNSNILYNAPTIESRAHDVVADRRKQEYEQMVRSYCAAQKVESKDSRFADTSNDDDDLELEEEEALAEDIDSYSQDTNDGKDDNDEDDEDDDKDDEKKATSIQRHDDDDDEEYGEFEEDDMEDQDIDAMFPDRDDMLRFLVEQHRTKWSNYARNVQKDIPLFDPKNETPQQRRDDFPVHLVAVISLLKMLSTHRGNGLKLFNNLMKWVIHFSRQDANVWNDAADTGLTTRDAVMTELTNIFDAEHLRPTPKEVTLSGGRRVDVQVFNFEKQLIDLLTDPSLLNVRNMHREHFDTSTWKPTASYDTMSDNDCIGDVHTGRMYQQGINEYCSGDPPQGTHCILPFPIILSSDESNQDSNFGNTTTPITWRPAILRNEARCKTSSSRTLCFLPNTKIGTGKNRNRHDEEWEEEGKTRGRKKLTPKKIAMDKVQDMQSLYRAGLSSLLQFIHNKGGGVPLIWQGKRCFVKVFVLFLVGDAKEYNLITNHYNCPGNLGLHCLTPRCFCSPEQLAQAPRNGSCRRFNRADIWKTQQDHDYARRLSQHPEVSAFDALPLANVDQMICGSLPPESLHVNCLGNFRDVLLHIRRCIGKGDTNKATKDRFDMLFHHVSRGMRRSACKDMLPPSNRGGVMDVSRVTGKEINANVNVALAAMHTQEGTNFLKPLYEKKKLTYTKTLSAIEGLLAYNEWINATEIKKGDLDNAENAVLQLMEDLCEHAPIAFENDDGEGGNGRQKIKFHCLFGFITDMMNFGSARNFNGEHTERDHIVLVKTNGDATQKRGKKFTAQTARQEGLRQILQRAHRVVEHQCPTLDRHTCDMASSDARRLYDPEVRDDNFAVAGKCTLFAGAPDARHFQYLNHTWDRREKNVLQVPLCKDLLYQVVDHAMGKKWNRGLTVEVFTELRVTSDGGNTTYRATEDYSGEPWYDWAFIEDPTSKETHPAMIVGFLKYVTPGYPTFAKTEIEKRRPQDLLSAKEKDDTIYVALHAANKVMSYEDLSTQMITKFSITSNDDIYVFPVTSIKKPLIVARNFGAQSNRSYLRCMPRSEWPGLWVRRIKGAQASNTNEEQLP